MESKKELYISKINELCDSYKVIVSLSSLAIKENDIESVCRLHDSLKSLFNRILEIVELFDEYSVYQAVKTLDLEKIPDYLKEVSLIDSYNKLLALEYTRLKTEELSVELKLVRMCLDFDYKETLHGIKLAQILCDAGKYREAIMLSEYLTTICDIAPPWLVLGKAYRALGMYGISIKAYRSYLILNENDKVAKRELDEIYNEMLGIKV